MRAERPIPTARGAASAVTAGIETAMRQTLPFVPILGLLLFPCCEHHEERELPPPLPAMEQEPGDKIEVPPPEFEDGIFPCTDCHDPEIGYNATGYSSI